MSWQDEQRMGRELERLRSGIQDSDAATIGEWIQQLSLMVLNINNTDVLNHLARAKDELAQAYKKLRSGLASPPKEEEG